MTKLISTTAKAALAVAAANVLGAGVALVAGGIATFIGFGEWSVIAVMALGFTVTFANVLMARD